MERIWNNENPRPNSQESKIIRPEMKAFSNQPRRKSLFTGTLIIAGLIIGSLSSCGHKHGCDAYQGSTRSLKGKKKHRFAQVISSPATRNA